MLTLKALKNTFKKIVLADPLAPPSGAVELPGQVDKSTIVTQRSEPACASDSPVSNTASNIPPYG